MDKQYKDASKILFVYDKLEHLPFPALAGILRYGDKTVTAPDTPYASAATSTEIGRRSSTARRKLQSTEISVTWKTDSSVKEYYMNIKLSARMKNMKANINMKRILSGGDQKERYTNLLDFSIVTRHCRIPGTTVILTRLWGYGGCWPFRTSGNRVNRRTL